MTMKVYRRICVECGKEFETTSNRRLWCYDQHYRECPVCHKQFEVDKDHSAKICCSVKCKKYYQQSIHYGKFGYTHICILCGKEFIGGKDEYVCHDTHTIKCPYCDKLFTLKSYQIAILNKNPSAIITCGSKECTDKKRKATVSRRYGTEDDPTGQHYVYEKTSESLKKLYGVANPMQIDSAKHKAEATNIQRYGVAHYSQTEAFKDKAIATNQAKYDVDWFTQSDKYKEESKSTYQLHYGVDNVAYSKDFLQSIMTDNTKLDKLLQFKENPVEFLQRYDHKLSLKELSKDLGIVDSSAGFLLHKYNVPQDMIAYTYSYMEDEVYDFLCTILSKEQIVRNTFRIITPYELDIYIPKYNFAIECNPTSSHNSSIGMWRKDDKPLSPSYHKMKTDLCEKENIFLYHVFGYDWTWHKDIVKSMIANYLGATQTKIYGRKTQMKEVDSKIARQFLDNNHRQGYSNSSIRLGLYYNDELVSLMTFGKPRSTIGTSKGKAEFEYELVRFCNKLNTSVIGGASKLFTYFVKTYNPESIISFSDRAHTKGNLYKILGFEDIRHSTPGYVWVSYKDKAYSRLNAQKSNIKQFLKDDKIDLTQTEKEIMEQHNFVQVYDSGTITWLWKRR